MRIVGKRQPGSGTAQRDALDALVLELGGGAVKGVYRYRTADEANGDWDRWLSERVQRRIATSSTSPVSSTASTSSTR